MKTMKLLFWLFREAYKHRMEEGIREKVIEYWDNHSHAIPYRKHVLRQHSGRGIYKENCKHVMEMNSRNSKNQILVSKYHLPCSVSWNRGILVLIWFYTLFVFDSTLNSSYTMTHLWIFAKNIGMVNQLLTQCRILFLWYYAIGILKMCFSIKGV